jgi:hypothetical protein
MTLLLSFCFSTLLLTVSLLFVVATLKGLGHGRVFKLLTRAANHHFKEAIPRSGRRRAGSVCFVTGMSRTACTCPNCLNGGQDQ